MGQVSRNELHRDAVGAGESVTPPRPRRPLCYIRRHLERSADRLYFDTVNTHQQKRQGDVATAINR